MKKLIFSLPLLVLLLGCGGGKPPVTSPNYPPPSNPPSEPPSNGQSGYSEIITRIVAPNEVMAGEAALVELTTGDFSKDQILAETEVNWNWRPSSPTIRIEKLQDSRHWRFTFPAVDAPITYSISFLAVNTEHYMRFTGQFQIRVLPKPVVNPPQVRIVYPWDNVLETRVVGPGVKLQVRGRVYQGTNPVSRIEVVVDGRVVFTLNNPTYEFEFDLEEFGSPGTKPLIIRAVDTQGLAGEASVEIVNDEVVLERLAKDFLRRYATFGEGRVWRYGDLQDGPYTKPVRIYIWPEVQPYRHLVEEACEFWRRYTNIQFDIIPGSDVDLPVIVIKAKFDQNPPYAALTHRWFDPQGTPGKIAGGDIILYQSWYVANELGKIHLLAHEIGHVLVTEEHVMDGSVFQSPDPTLIIHPYQQYAVRLLYQMRPGASL